MIAVRSRGSDPLPPAARGLLPPTCGAGVCPGVAIGTRFARGEGPTSERPSPVDGLHFSTCGTSAAADVARSIAAAEEAFRVWRCVPAPTRGQFVRRIGDLVRQHKHDLAAIVTLEAGKIRSESEGEIQEWIDICDFAVGLSRQLHGLTIASERPEHRLMEQWHPLGAVGVITAFNFPAAVWAWNAMLAFVCGDPVVWKPSPQTPLTALACHGIVMEAAQDFPEVPEAVSCVCLGGTDAAMAVASDLRLPLVSATGSTAMGREVAKAVAARLGRSLLELGGNNGMIVTPSANLEMAVRAILFSAVGTCGQRCTSLRRLIAHATLEDALVGRLAAAYGSLPIGDPRDPHSLVGPLVSPAARDRMEQAIAQAVREGGEVICGGERVEEGVPGGAYVRPAIVRMPSQTAVVHEETFAPILYVLSYESLDEAIAMNNAVPQGLASAILTGAVREAERFLGPAGSDCGIANVNIGTSGAEIGGAFGGEKETGGGRESGSDAWKHYMRRATNTINYGTSLPLAQGVRFSPAPPPPS
jgi:aldehyde dehydrogenase (NAD+)